MAADAARRPALRSWSELIGNRHLSTWFARAIETGKLTGSLLFVGPHGVGKKSVARLLARTLLCETVPPARMAPCGVCPACQQVDAGTHPDLILVAKPADRSFIPLDLLIGPPEARMQAGFCRDVRLRPSRGRRKVAMLVDADFLNEEGANCLLKTLEEPPSGALVILVGTSEQRQLPTIRSRCRIIRFASPVGAQAAELLRRGHGIEASDERIDRAVEMAAGDLRVARRMLSEDDQWRGGLAEQLSRPNIDPVALTRQINAVVEQAGKDASKRRDALRDIFSVAIQHYRGQLRRGAADAEIRVDKTIDRLDRCLRAVREVDRSANQATLVECFAADIANAETGDRGAIG